MSWVEIIADRKIRDAQDEGKFDHLEGAGQPINLDFDPNVPPEQRVAYRIMREAHLLPDWIEAEKEIRQLQARWDEQARAFERRRADLRLEGRTPGAAEAERIESQREAFLLQAAQGLLELNRRIDRYNLIVPAPSRQRARIAAVERMRELEERLPPLRPRTGGGRPAWEALFSSENRELKLDNRMPLRRRRDTIG